MRMNLQSLGAYPDQVWYDPTRPSWLPYWIDDFTESANKYGSTSITDQMAGVVGAAAGAVGSAAGSAIGTGLSNAVGSAVEASGGGSASTISWTLIAAAVAAAALIFAVKK